jgi:hypothetical protein
MEAQSGAPGRADATPPGESAGSAHHARDASVALAAVFDHSDRSHRARGLQMLLTSDSRPRAAPSAIETDYRRSSGPAVSEPSIRWTLPGRYTSEGKKFWRAVVFGPSPIVS